MGSLDAELIWYKHELDGGRLTVWIEEGARARAIAVDERAVYPRLEPRDFSEQTALRTRAACDAYTRQRRLDVGAARMLHALQAGLRARTA